MSHIQLKHQQALQGNEIHSFLADGLNIFTQTFATQLSYVTIKFTWKTLQTLLQLFSFLG